MANLIWSLQICPGVMVVASANEPVNDWAAYIGVVGRGNLGAMNLSVTEENVKAYGDKIDPKIAALLFPDQAKKYRWRA